MMDTEQRTHILQETVFIFRKSDTLCHWLDLQVRHVVEFRVIFDLQAIAWIGHNSLGKTTKLMKARVELYSISLMKVMIHIKFI